MPANTHSFECRDLPIDKVVVFNDRAEITRRIFTKLGPGSNEVHVKNVTKSLISDTIRVEGRGDAKKRHMRTGTMRNLYFQLQNLTSVGKCQSWELSKCRLWNNFVHKSSIYSLKCNKERSLEALLPISNKQGSLEAAVLSNNLGLQPLRDPMHNFHLELQHALPKEPWQASSVEDHVLSSEFKIARKTTVPSGTDKTKVTIGITEMTVQLVHECVPSKNSSVFLTATALNESNLPLLRGPVAVYINNSYLAKTNVKNVSPGERFSCSLGVDPAVRVDYKPAKKYKEETGVFNKAASNITEQMLNVKNTRPTEILLTIHENIPRTTDDRIKVYVVNPPQINGLGGEANLHDAFKAPTEGARLNNGHNLEWTVKMAPGEVKNLEFKWAAEYTKDEKVKYAEKF